MVETGTAQQEQDIATLIPVEASEAATKKPKAAKALALVIERSALLKALGHVQNVVEKRTTIPILSNVKLKAAGGVLALTATDMELAVTETVEASIRGEGTLTVPAHTFYDIVRKLPDGAQVELDATKEGTLEARAGSCKFSLSSLGAEEFPVMDDTGLTHHFSLPVAELVALIDKTRFAISTEETRYYLNGIYLHALENQGESVLRSVATDGHRMARMEVALPEGAAGMPSVIIPRKAVLELRKVAEESAEVVNISLSATKIRFVCGEVVLLSKLIDGTFPDYDKVIPANNDKIMEVDTKAFMQAVDRVSTISSEKSRAIRLQIESGKLVLSATGEGNGSAQEELDVQYSADPVDTGFNSRYLMEAVSCADGDTVQFLFSDNSAPVLARDVSDVRALYVVMPMRV